MTAIHAFGKRQAISDVYLPERLAVLIGSWLPNSETAYLSHLSRIEQFPFGCPETSVHKYQPTPQNQSLPETCGRPGQIKYSGPI